MDKKYTYVEFLYLKNVDFFHHYFESIQKTENGEVLVVQ